MAKAKNSTYRRGLEDHASEADATIRNALERLGASAETHAALRAAIDRMNAGAMTSAPAIRQAFEKLNGGSKAYNSIRDAVERMGAGPEAQTRFREALVRYTSASAGAIAEPPKQVPLYVMVAPEQLDRFKSLARESGMSLREYVTNAVEAFSAQMSKSDDELGALLTTHNASSDQLRSIVSSQAVRLSTVEKRLDTLQRWVERNFPNWDRVGPPEPLFPIDSDSASPDLSDELEDE